MVNHRARGLLALVASASLLVSSTAVAAAVTQTSPSAGGGSVTMGAIPDQTLEIYPGLVDLSPTVIPLELDPADAEVTIRTTSSDKATVAFDDGDLVITPVAAGTMHVRVTASKTGLDEAVQDFAVNVDAYADTGEYDWSGYAKIGGGGYVTGSVFSQIEENVLYAKTDVGGAYRYDFERDYWVGLNDDATDHSAAFVADDPRGPGRGATSVISIMPDPVQPGRVYMAAGRSATNAAIYRSDDYGDTWARFPIATAVYESTNRSTGERLAIDPRNNDIVYFASQNAGLWKSVDAGETFTRITDSTDLAVNYRPTFVAIDPNSPVDDDGNSTRVIVGTIGTTTQNAPAASEANPLQHRPYASLFISQDGGDTFAEMAGQPTGRADRRYGGFVAEHFAFDTTGKMVVAYAEFSLSDLTQVGSNSNFAQDGRVFRFDLAAGTSENITPHNVFTREHPALTATDIDAGQVMQRGGIGGIAVDPRRPGVMVASSFHRHANYSEEVVWYTSNAGTSWTVIHSEVVGIKDYRGYGYIDKDNGWSATVHWAFNIQLNPYDSDMALFTTGNGFWMTKNLTAADEPLTAQNQVVWGFWNDGLEESVIWNLYSPSDTDDYVFSTFADWGSMSWARDTTISPRNALVNAESPANRVRYLDPPFDAQGNPRYDLDDEGNVQWYLKDGYYERWRNTQNLDYAGLQQNVMVLTPSGNYQNTNVSAGVISFDEGRTATPLAVPAGITGEGPSDMGNAGWIAISADAATVVWTVSDQAVANAYWTDVSDGPDAAAVGSHDTRPQGSAEVRQVVKHGDREAWTKVTFTDTTGNPVTTGNVKIFSDKVDPDVFYGLRSGALFVSTDAGRTFAQVALEGAGVPAVNWNTSGHSQGSNKVQIDPFNTRTLYLASNNATAGLVRITYDAVDETWVGTKVNQGAAEQFQQVGIGLGLGDNSVPALYAMGLISDNTGVEPLAPRYGMYRSLDGGTTWKRINDDAHQFGYLRALSGDSRLFGRVYLGTGGRGIRVGDIAWEIDHGSDDLVELWSLEVAAGGTGVAAGELLELTAHLTDPWGEATDVSAETVFTFTTEATVVDEATLDPTVSFTYVIRGVYPWSDGTNERTLTSAPVRVEVYRMDALVPIITGTAAVGEVLTAEVPAGWPVSYQWLRNGDPIDGATGDEYTVTEADAGSRIAVSAIVDRAGGAAKISPSVRIPLSVSFTDVPSSHSFYDDIMWLAQSGITGGYADGTFRPGRSVARDEMAAFLYRLVNDGEAAPACTARPFPDVPVTSGLCGEVAWMKTEGLTRGYSDGTYRPKSTVSRAEIAAFLYRLVNDGETAPACTTAPFTDVSVNNSFCGDISWLASTGITSGYSDGTFRPRTTMVRQHMAAFLHRAVEADVLG